MGATKRFYEECAEAGRCPVSRETCDYLDNLECERQIDWIGYTEHDYTGHDGRLYVADCITMGSARRLVAEGLANDADVAATVAAARVAEAAAAAMPESADAEAAYSAWQRRAAAALDEIMTPPGEAE